jgi:hypothetical protein
VRCVQVPAVVRSGRLLSTNCHAIIPAPRHAKLIFFHERLLSLHLRFNGARNCSVEKCSAAPRDCIYPTRESERTVIIIESISAEFAPRVSSRDAQELCWQRVYKPQFTRLVIKPKFRRRARFIRLSTRFLSPAPHANSGRIYRNERWMDRWVSA